MAGVVCNLCGWEGDGFEDDEWHQGILCPACRSRVRHRLLGAALGLPDRSMLRELTAGKSILHIAPESCLRSVFSRYAGIFHTADRCEHNCGAVEMRLDISQMDCVHDSTYDIVIACDVLEHVQEHTKAIRELFRIAKPGGCAILTVPQMNGLERTPEDTALDSPEERARLFGQADHYRVYGEDFPELLAASGFVVTVVSAADFDDVAVAKYVLFPPIPSPHPLATNDRKVFFAAKEPES